MGFSIILKKLFFFFIILQLCTIPTFSAFHVISSENIFAPFQTVSSAPYEYHTYDSMTLLLNNLSQAHPDIMRLTSIGTTYEGRDIWMVKLSENVTRDDDEPSVLFMGAHHGDEKPSFEVLIFFINYIIDTYQMNSIDDDGDEYSDESPECKRVRDILNTTQIYIIPMVNPDGVEYGWRKNREPNYGANGQSTNITSYGVDLNRNYGYMWNIVYLFPENYFLEYLLNDQSWIYRGEAPFSEKETQAVKRFIENHDISISLSYHDYGEFMIFPWMHTSRHTPHESLYRSIGANMSNINNYELKIYGQYGEREYIIPRYQGTPGSSENWLYGEHGILAFTMELCRRRPERNPSLVLDACEKHVEVNLYICERAQTIEQEKHMKESKISKGLFFDRALFHNFLNV
ncbi:MAG: M14 family metallopeptidase [Candidatus Thermoplasmatota archaeon]|nr:M14 family metallopeptidase [Candidatus Thermoplasmatota archaeon]